MPGGGRAPSGAAAAGDLIAAGWALAAAIGATLPAPRAGTDTGADGLRRAGQPAIATATG